MWGSTAGVLQPPPLSHIKAPERPELFKMNMFKALQWDADAPNRRDLLPPKQPGAGVPEPVGFRRPQKPLSHKEKAKALADSVEKLGQQVRDALFARSSHNLSEERILKAAFVKFDKDASGNVDIDEFCQALEHLGLHVEGLGAPGLGGIPRHVVDAVFASMDEDGCGCMSLNCLLFSFDAISLTPGVCARASCDSTLAALARSTTRNLWRRCRPM